MFLRLCLTLSSHGLSDLILNFDIFSRQKLGVEIFCVCVKLIIHHSFPEAAAAALAEKQDLVLLDELLKKAQKAREVQAKVNKMQKFFFNVVVLGVVTQSPKQRLVINMLDGTDFGVKVYFCGGRKTGESKEKPSESD